MIIYSNNLINLPNVGHLIPGFGFSGLTLDMPLNRPYNKLLDLPTDSVIGPHFVIRTTDKQFIGY